MDVHTRDLRYFLAVADALHFTAAAERLHVSQPALSKQIRALERRLGVDLFVRDRRSVTLTDAGEVLVGQARRVVAEWDDVWSALARYADGLAARLVIGMSTGLGRSGLLPAIRARFAERRPGIELELRQVGWSDSTAGLADGSSDLAFVWLPIEDAVRFGSMVVAEEPRVVALAETHPLAERRELAVADVLDQPLLALPRAAGPIREHWLLAEHRNGGSAPVGATVQSGDETYEALVDGRGIVVLASGNAPLLTRGGVVVRPLRDTADSRLALAWRADDDRDVVADYVGAAREVVRQRVSPGR